jgi:hypothetical protein
VSNAEPSPTILPVIGGEFVAFTPVVFLQVTVDAPEESEIVPTGRQRVATQTYPLVEPVENGSDERKRAVVPALRAT